MGYCGGQTTGEAHRFTLAAQVPSGHGTAPDGYDTGTAGHTLTSEAQVPSMQRTGVEAGQTTDDGQFVMFETHSKPEPLVGHDISPMLQVATLVGQSESDTLGSFKRQLPSAHLIEGAGHVTIVGQRPRLATQLPSGQTKG